MAKFSWVGVALLAALSGCASVHYCDSKNGAATTTASANCPPEAPREARGVWVATVGNIDWPSKPGLSTDEQLKEMRAILDRCRLLNMNVVVFQVRTSCDAMYASPYEPWSYYLTGKQGQPPEPFYDPLKEWVAEAHQRGLELHAWFNPFRARPGDAKYELAPNHVMNTMKGETKQYGKSLWQDPGEPAAQEHTLKVMADVVRRYDVDGIHIDDYFYPYREKGPDGKELDFPDEPSWQRYQATGGKLSRDDWRRDNIDHLVHRMYTQTKSIKPWVKVGISPFGFWRPHNPPSVTSTFDAYQSIYCDSKLWINEGWLDYWVPQQYWGLNEKGKPPYQDLSDWWVKENTHQRNFWPGLYTGRIPRAWKSQEILDQIASNRKTPGVSGEVHFSMKVLMRDADGIDGTLKNGPYAQEALVPAFPWLGNKTPTTPHVSVVKRDGAAEVSWKKGGLFSKQPWQWVVAARFGDTWKTWIYPSSEHHVVLHADEKLGEPQAVTVRAVDRLGNESRKTEALPIGK